MMVLLRIDVSQYAKLKRFAEIFQQLSRTHLIITMNRIGNRKRFPMFIDLLLLLL